MTSPTAVEFFYPPRPAFNLFSGLSKEYSKPDPTVLREEKTITFVPSNGSTCVSLYPRTMTFTLYDRLDGDSFLATSGHDMWRISKDSEVDTIGEESNKLRFTFERLGRMQGNEPPELAQAPVEIFKRCTVEVARGYRNENHRRTSIGDYSSGYGGPLSPRRTMSIPLSPVIPLR